MALFRPPPASALSGLRYSGCWMTVGLDVDIQLDRAVEWEEGLGRGGKGGRGWNGGIAGTGRGHPIF